MAQKYLAPPALDPEKYAAWKTEMAIWELATPLAAEKRAPSVFLTLEGSSRNAVREISPQELGAADGMKKLYDKLDTLHLADKNVSALLAYEKFEKFKRAEGTSVKDYLNEFDHLEAELKTHNITLPPAVLAYRALKSANLSDENERLIRATVSDLTLAEMSKHLKKVMEGYDSEKFSNSMAVNIKKEPEVSFIESKGMEKNSDQENKMDDEQEVYYGYQSYGRNRSNNRRPWRGGRARGRNNFTNRGAGSRGSNPLDQYGNPSKCAVCGSTFHWARSCPDANRDRESESTLHEVKIVLMSHNVQEKRTLLGQTIGAMILDSGCTKTVCGSTWLECFLETLSKEEQKSIKTSVGINKFKFGNGQELPSIKHVTLPCIIGNVKVDINTDVVESEIPLLLSKAAMKKAKTKLDFVNDKVQMLGRTFELSCTDNGHYYVPITKSLPVNGDSREVLFISDLNKISKNDKTKIINKLHRQFSHPSSEKMNRFVKNAGVTDREFLDILSECPCKCEICIKYKKTEPRPVVGLPLATRFNETVVMDIKEIKGNKVLHLVDYATRYSVAAKLKSKESLEIIATVFKYWISYFGAPKMFLTDNGGEFDNENFRDMAQNLNMIIKTTAAESPWSNGLNERHNGILGETVIKTLEDVGCPFDIALHWGVSAKNTLQNVHGYSPNQLVFGFNPNLPSILNDRLPALEGVTTSEMIANNLNAMHKARKAYIESESSERLRRALRHNVRSSIAYKYNNGDLVYYKRNKSNRWQGPGSVIGWENKQVLIKHGGSYVRVHPCRLQTFKTNQDLVQDNSCQ